MMEEKQSNFDRLKTILGEIKAKNEQQKSEKSKIDGEMRDKASLLER